MQTMPLWLCAVIVAALASVGPVGAAGLGAQIQFSEVPTHVDVLVTYQTEDEEVASAASSFFSC